MGRGNTRSIPYLGNTSSIIQTCGSRQSGPWGSGDIYPIYQVSTPGLVVPGCENARVCVLAIPVIRQYHTCILC